MDKKLFARLLDSTREMDEIVRGRRAASREFTLGPADIQGIRHATGLSQEKFAALIEVSLSTLRNWEQGQREPSGPAKVLLGALLADPTSVIKAIRKAFRAAADDVRARHFHAGVTASAGRRTRASSVRKPTSSRR